jgi:hypothetical protein
VKKEQLDDSVSQIIAERDELRERANNLNAANAEREEEV